PRSRPRPDSHSFPTRRSSDLEGKPLKFTATVEVTPEVELGEYKGIKVEKLVEQVEAKDIDHMLEHFQEDHAELVSPDRNTVEQRSEEHTSELQSRENLVCRLL